MAKWTMRWRTGQVVVVAVLVAASGCAAREATFASRFVKPGEPSATYDDPAAATPAPVPLSDYIRKTRALQSKAAPKSSFLPTIESSNPDLMRALLLLKMHESAEHHRLAAIAYRQVGVLDHAYRHFQRATVIDSCDAASYDGMARIWRDWQMPELGLPDVYRALHCNKKSAAIYNTLGTILEAMDQSAGAERAYRSALALDSRATFALNNLCYIRMTHGDGLDAARFCEAALAVDPNLAAARNNLALIEAKQGDFAGAERRLRASPSAVSFYNVGVMRLSEGRYSDAALVFDQASATQPSWTMAHRRSVQARKAARAAEQAR